MEKVIYGKKVGNIIYIPCMSMSPDFHHRQLFVAISRVKSKKGLKSLIHDNEKNPTDNATNTVFKEVFQNE